MLRAIDALGLFDRTRAPAADDRATTGQIDEFNRNIDGTPAFYWLVTEGNDRITQVNAGPSAVEPLQSLRSRTDSGGGGRPMWPVC